MNGSTIPWARSLYERGRINLIHRSADYSRINKDNYDALQAEWENIIRALGWAVGMESPVAVEWVNDLGSFVISRGYWDDGLKFVDQVTPLAQRLYAEEQDEEKHVYALASLRLMQAGFYVMKGEVEEAGTILGAILEDSGLSSHRSIGGGAAALMGLIAEKSGDLDLSLSQYNVTIESAETAGYLPLVGFLLLVTADLLAQQGNFEEAFTLYRRKLEVDRRGGDIASIVDTLIGLSDVAHHAQLPEVSAECLQEASALAQTLASPDVQHEILRKLANHAYKRKEYQEAVSLNEQALNLARQTGNKTATASTLLFLAFAREEMGEDVTGLIRESLSISQELVDYEGMAMAMIQLGDAYLVKHEPARAQEQYAEAANIAVRIKNHPLAAAAWLNAGELMASEGNWPEAEQYYEFALTAHQHFDDPSSRAMILRGLGQVYFLQDKLTSARDTIQRNIELYSRLEDWENYGECLYELACVFAQERKIVEAEELLQRSFDILNGLESPSAELARVAMTNIKNPGLDEGQSQ